MVDPRCDRLLEAALAYGDQGWAVFPLYHPVGKVCSCEDPKCSSPGKHPRTVHGLNDASTDPETIRRWWLRWPEANVGIRTGKDSGFVVLDEDPYHGAERAIEVLATIHGPLPSSLESATGGGGRHFLFAHPGVTIRNRTSLPVPGVDPSGLDVRGDGGYIVAPPSLHLSGAEYQWIRPIDGSVLAPMPGWLLELSLNGAAQTDEGSPSRAGSLPIPEGERNDTLFRLACSLRARGAEEPEIRAKVSEVACDPPLSPGELSRIVESACRYPREFNATDLGNAQRLVTRHGQDLRYCHPLKTWLVWDGKRWKRDQTAEVMRRGKETIRALYTEAALLADTERAVLVKHALGSEKEDRLRAMVSLATSEPGIVVLPEDLDSDPWLLCVKNGTVDLRTGALRPHSRDDLITKMAPVAYDPDATCPVLDSFLNRMVPDPEERSFLQRGTGYTLTGDTSEEVLLFIHGPTNAGKSTFTEAVKATMGDYAVTADFEAFLRRREPGIRNDIARMAGARMVLSLEVEEGRRIAVATIKSLTGGDTVTARFLHKEFFEFRPAFKPWLVANHKPAANASDSAFWRRILVVPFTTEIPKSELNPRVKKALRDSPQSRSAILAWAVRGCLAWQKEGLRPPPRVVQATETYRTECDTVQQFIAARCIKSPGRRAAFEDLYSSYKECCELNDDIAVSDKAFGKELTKRGFTPKRGTGGRRERVGIGPSDSSDASDLWSDKSPLEPSCSEKDDGQSLRSPESLDRDDHEPTEERAAILEYEGGVGREEAEIRARSAR
ncbi:MAG: phage/plasmid primase, P4 family [Candidatus Eisenbacteria bacterium]